MPDRMARAARHYTAALGWALVPDPARLEGTEPKGLATPRKCIRGPGPLVRLLAPPVPMRAWACCTAPSGTATVDADAPADYIARALAAVGIDYGALLAAPGPKIQGNPAKPTKLLFRLPSGCELSRRALRWPDAADPSIERVLFELRGGSVQDVLPPTVHKDTGEPYRWVGAVPMRPDDVPIIPPELLALWNAWPANVPVMRDACPWAPPPLRRTHRPPVRRHTHGHGIIDRYNAYVSVPDVLARAGYREHGGRWIAPGSTTGTAGVVLLDDGRCFSHHASDVLADDHAHSAFNVLCRLEHGGDVRAAVRAAAAELGLSRRSQTRSRSRRAR